MANTFNIHVHIDYPERSAKCVMYDATVLELVLDMRNYMRLGAITAYGYLENGIRIAYICDGIVYADECFIGKSWDVCAVKETNGVKLC